ncbi:cytochrome c oxidase subunit II [Paraurantiacibacter namhicola]|uniref:Cytochrome c oxidase subunit 2 n=1 Tax=Paraurantiacibacter namhicola TaxID=645517 RepID=A0A1C7D7F6_9SPHN|nr:cytochrome c oxidase subunit II [Paraurantiacibacter namhicola]ANU07410.1 Cytochrome c oxidase subunit 2 precursor [Paraurantiacibacter namhicola]
MTLGEIARKHLNFLGIMAALGLLAAPVSAMAANPQSLEGVPNPIEMTAEENAADPTISAVEAAEGTTGETVTTDAASGYTPLGPDMIKGQPVSAEDDLLGSMTFQPQFTDIGDDALFMHDIILMPIITFISLFVLGLLLWVIVKYRRKANPVPSKTSHNTLIEVIWTIVPVLILVVIAVPSISLLAKQYKSPPEDALTIKVTGYQWYWGYTYPDNGDFEVISNMMDEGEALAKNLPPQLAVDNRMVVPVGEPLRLQISGADVIHSFAIPSLWFKMDAVPGRLNEKTLTIKEPGIYYGQCMELCGARHGYMPIAIEAVPRAQFEAWVRGQPGGTVGEAAEDAAPITETELPGLQQPESAVEDAPGAGLPPTEDTSPTT